MYCVGIDLTNSTLPGMRHGFPIDSVLTSIQDVASMPQLDVFSVREVTQTVHEAVSGTLEFENGQWALGFNWQGTKIFRMAETDDIFVVPQKSVFFTRQPKLLSRLSEGAHGTTYVLWNSSETPILENWFRSIPRIFAVLRMSGEVLVLSEKLRRLMHEERPTSGLRTNALVYDLVASLMEHHGCVQVADVPDELPEVLSRLVNDVLSDASAYWPLPRAAKQTGYSTTHFSRMFRSEVGCGFQTFVEQCRTEIAIELLRTTKKSVDSIAEEAGFGAAQAMRSALREYVGVVPSDIRAL